MESNRISKRIPTTSWKKIYIATCFNKEIQLLTFHVSQIPPIPLNASIDKPTMKMSFPLSPLSPETKSTKVQENKVAKTDGTIPLPTDDSARTDAETATPPPSPPPPAEIMCTKVSWKVMIVVHACLLFGWWTLVSLIGPIAVLDAFHAKTSSIVN